MVLYGRYGLSNCPVFELPPSRASGADGEAQATAGTAVCGAEARVRRLPRSARGGLAGRPALLGPQTAAWRLPALCFCLLVRLPAAPALRPARTCAPRVEPCTTTRPHAGCAAAADARVCARRSSLPGTKLTAPHRARRRLAGSCRRGGRTRADREGLHAGTRLLPRCACARARRRASRAPAQARRTGKVPLALASSPSAARSAAAAYAVGGYAGAPRRTRSGRGWRAPRETASCAFDSLTRSHPVAQCDRWRCTLLTRVLYRLAASRACCTAWRCLLRC